MCIELMAKYEEMKWTFRYHKSGEFWKKWATKDFSKTLLHWGWKSLVLYWKELQNPFLVHGADCPF